MFFNLYEIVQTNDGLNLNPSILARTMSCFEEEYGTQETAQQNATCAESCGMPLQAIPGIVHP